MDIILRWNQIGRFTRTAVIKILAKHWFFSNQQQTCLSRKADEDYQTWKSRKDKISMALQYMGPKAASAIPELLKLAKSNDNIVLHNYIAATLAKMGSSSISALVKAQTDKDPAIRCIAIRALGKMVFCNIVL